MEQDVLPVGQSPLRSYLHHLFPLAVAAISEEYVPWFLSTFIQLYRAPGKRVDFYLGSRDIFNCSCPLIEYYTECLPRLTAREVMELIECRLNDGWYVVIDLDYYHMDWSPSFRRTHFLHPVMVSGVSRDDLRFLVNGLGPKGNQGNWWIGCGMMSKSLETPPEAFTERFLGQAIPSWAQRASQPKWLYMYRHREGGFCDWDFGRIRQLVHSYLNATPPIGAMVEGEPGLWGRQVYSYYRDIARSGTFADGIGIRHSRLLLEHKQTLKLCVEHLASLGLVGDDLSVMYGHVLRAAQRYHYLCMLSYISGKGRDASQLLRALDEMELWEERALSVVALLGE